MFPYGGLGKGAALNELRADYGATQDQNVREVAGYISACAEGALVGLVVGLPAGDGYGTTIAGGCAVGIAIHFELETHPALGRALDNADNWESALEFWYNVWFK